VNARRNPDAPAAAPRALLWKWDSPLAAMGKILIPVGASAADAGHLSRLRAWAAKQTKVGGRSPPGEGSAAPGWREGVGRT